MITELDVVELRSAFAGVTAGARGTVLEVFTRPDTAYLVEFSDEDGQEIATTVLKKEQVSRVWSLRDGWYVQPQPKAA